MHTCMLNPLNPSLHLFVEHTHTHWEFPIFVCFQTPLPISWWLELKLVFILHLAETSVILGRCPAYIDRPALRPASVRPWPEHWQTPQQKGKYQLISLGLCFAYWHVWKSNITPCFSINTICSQEWKSLQIASRGFHFLGCSSWVGIKLRASLFTYYDEHRVF